MKIFVVGHQGMLGHVAVRFLKQQGCEVITSSMRSKGGARDPLVEAVRDSGCCWVIRTSIIGPETGKGWGLMGWFFAQSGDVKGFTNHLWNGITTLEWTEIAWDLINDRLQCKEPLVQAGTWPPKSKCEVLQLIAKVWRHPVKIVPAEAKDRI